jgi:squalene-hopene/tetraprenyl-beta-curcumene cyclase
MFRAILVSLVAIVAFADERPEPKAQTDLDIPLPTATKGGEPKAKTFSALKAGEYLDRAGIHWTREHQCITCHTNMPYLTAAPLLKGRGWKEVREFLDADVNSWAAGGKPKGDAYVVATAFALAFNDAQQGGKLADTTRAALDRMWDVQSVGGAWNWLKCDWPPLEHDDYYGATLAALAVGYAPGDYAKSERAQAGLKKLTRYFAETPAPDLHHAAMLLWASTKLAGLMTEPSRAKVVRDLKAKQRPDGGWSLPSLGAYRRRDKAKTLNDGNADSDGYGTGFVTFVLLEAGEKPAGGSVSAAVRWLKSNQRESGRWYTRSLNNDRAHYITNAGTAFCVLALSEAGELGR